MAGYWEGRKDLNYYSAVRRILDDLGPRESILDVGPLDTPIASWGQFTRRYTVGPDARAQLDGVTAIRGLWPDVAGEIQLPVEVVTCLQVIEHLPETLSFAAALFSAASELVIISVPYQWPESACHYHVHDPIDEEKLTQLVGRTAGRVEIVNDGGWRRMIAQYDTAAQDSRLPLPAIRTRPEENAQRKNPKDSKGRVAEDQHDTQPLRVAHSEDRTVLGVCHFERNLKHAASAVDADNQTDELNHCYPPEIINSRTTSSTTNPMPISQPSTLSLMPSR